MRIAMFMIPAVYQGGKGKRVGADFVPPADAVAASCRLLAASFWDTANLELTK